MTGRLTPLKRFGQNFLVDKNILKKILSAVHFSPGDALLEIGPGDGALTLALASKAHYLLAVEIDRGRFQELSKKISHWKNIDIRQGDFLKFDVASAARRQKVGSFVVVANIPYYITTPILEHLFHHIGLIKDIYLTVQKEVAQRFIAKPGTKAYGSLSCFVQYFTKPEALFLIKAGSFWPVPKVDSYFVRLTPYGLNNKPWLVKSEKRLFEVMRASFGQRRKTLASSLARLAGKDALEKIAPKDLLFRRPETLSLADFAVVANQLT